MEEIKTNKLGIELIAEERKRQIEEGYSLRHDDQETTHQLSNAAIIQSNEINSEFKGQKIIHRIKPESQYRPFENQEECWNEILKHQPFGWIKSPNGDLSCIDKIFDKGVTYDHSSRQFSDYIANNYTFADGTPFGIKI